MATKFHIRNEIVLKNCISFISQLPFGGWVVEIKKTKRSNPQNNYWHKLVDILGKGLGYKPEEMKAILKDSFLGYDEIEYAGRLIKVPRKTSDLNTEQMAELITKTLALGMEMNIHLPDASYFGLEE